ncbi:immunoglobulin-like domain-containing protein [Listeria marthii]|uniref:immunoglobulin-like domain-containing protein n=1 Tax=Listeria marthii TaxID=529731 RepID=UPI001E400D32|nr:immunoglobulin-like domain-containing protein [Listeria marthii]MCD2255056.1 DUF5011 domain-containing protein [Listeria marthii]
MSQTDKQNSLKEVKGRRPNKTVVGISVAAMLLIGGGIGTGFYLNAGTDVPESKSESRIKHASEAQKPTTDIKEKSPSSDELKKQQEDLLGIIVGKQETENSQVAAILDGPTQTSKEKTMQARNVALAAMAHLPSDVPTTTDIVLPGKTDLQVVENPLGPKLPSGQDLPPVKEPTIPTPGEVEPQPDPTPANTAPQLVASNHTIHIGSNFNPYNFATASDEEDGDLTSSIQVISNNVNPDREGTYTVTYRVTDSAGETVERSISIEVVNDAPVLHVADRQVSVGEVFNPMESVSANDTEDGDVTSHIEVIENNVDTQTPGSYTVTYKVMDSHGKETTKTIHIKVVNDKPTIIANDKELTVGDTFNPLEGVTATDKQDGDLTNQIQVKSNDVDTAKAGTYHVTYEVEDTAGGKTEKTITITVNDENEDL